MSDRRKVLLSLDPEDPDEESFLYSYDYQGTLTRIPQDQQKSRKKSKPKKSKVKEQYYDILNSHLPFIKYHDTDPFQLAEDIMRFEDDKEGQQFNMKIFNYCDACPEREITVSNFIGIKNYNYESISNAWEHRYLPGLPKLIYEEYPLFRPSIEYSREIHNEEFIETHYKRFSKRFDEAMKRRVPEYPYAYETDLQTPVYVDDLTSTEEHAFYTKVWLFISEEIFDGILLTDQTLDGYFKDDEKSLQNLETPILNHKPNISLKPIGSVGESPLSFGIIDKDSELLHKLLVHVETVNMTLGIGEGYELYFNTLRKNFIEPELRVRGPDSTKIDNFLKIFTKCVAICLNSKTNRFIITDYYWCGTFEIEDILDGEIEDVYRLVSKVKVKHFGFSNFENDEKLTIRNIVASFFNFRESHYHKASENIELLNFKVVKEWNDFKQDKSSLIIKPSKKKLKRSPFVYRPNVGIEFTKRYVDLDKSLISYVAVNNSWSCQTLEVDLKKLFIDDSDLTKVIKDHNLNLSKISKKPTLLAIYDEYYQDDIESMISRHLKNAKVASATKIKLAIQMYRSWLSNVEAYMKAKDLQGTVLAKVLDYGFLEDKAHNTKFTHFKADGYFILYEPIGENENIVQIEEKHSLLVQEALKKLHKCGVSFSPSSELTREVFKLHKDTVHIINLEDCNTAPSKEDFNKDLSNLAKLFKNYL